MLKQLLGNISPSTFVAEYYNRLPFSLQGGAKGLCELGDWPLLEKILGDSKADVLVARQGGQHAAEVPRTSDEAKRLTAEGYTILVRHAERHDERLTEIAQSFAADLGGEVNIHIYSTPGGQHGFGWHYDAEEVFILQTTGRKEYSLRKNTVNPWPLVETIPADMKYERELMPLMRVMLAAGDWLYIPSGYWHYGSAEQDAISLAVGVMAPTAIDVFDTLRRELLDSILWRQRMPVAARAATLSPDELRARYREVLSQLAADLEKRLGDEKLVERLLRKFGRE